MRHVVNRLLVLIVGLAVIALAIVVIVEVIAELAGADPVLVSWPSVYAWAQRTTWSDAMALGISLLLAAGTVAVVRDVASEPGPASVAAGVGAHS